MSVQEALIVERDGDGKHFIRDALRERGFAVRYCGSVTEVAREWGLYRRSSLFVIADDVPGGGLTLLKQVRNDADNPATPVMFILDDKTEERVKAVVAAKPDAVVARPYTMALIQSRLDAILRDEAA